MVKISDTSKLKRVIKLPLGIDEKMIDQNYSRPLIESFPVSPETAANWLDTANDGNRPCGKAQVRYLASQMEKGQWKLNGECLFFDSKGRLQSGQHRLEAVIESGKTILFDIRLGLPVSGFETIDQGKRRSISDAFSIMGKKYAGVLAAGMPIANNIKNGRMGTRSGLSENTYTIKDAITSLKKNPEYEQIASEATAFYNQGDKLLSPAVICGFMILFSEADKDAVNDFFEQLCLGVGVKKSSPVYTLRKKLNTYKNAKDRTLSIRARNVFIIKTWNAIRKGKSMKVLKYDPDQKIEIV